MNSDSNNDMQAKYIELHFEKPYGSSMDKKIFWKYSQANYLEYDHIHSTSNGSGDAIPLYIEDNKTRVKFRKIEFLKDFPILHLWLHKVE